MANKVTGSTDTTGALTIAQKMAKSVLIVGQVQGSPETETEPDKIFSIIGTADTESRYGKGHVFVKAVKALIQNGVDSIYGMIVSGEVEGDRRLADNYADVLEKSLGEKTVKCIILDNYEDAVISELKTHLNMAEMNDLFRYAVIASTTDSNDEMIAYAEQMNHSRIFIVGPTFTNGETAIDPVVVVGGMTGVIMTETDDPALPMNGVVVNGIGNVNKAVLESERKLLAQNGVTALYNDGQPVIYRLVTSYITDEIWHEGTTRFIADYVLENVENVLRTSYKRTKNVTRILDSIKTTVRGILESFEGLEIIENFDPKTLTVVKDPTDLYGALVDYEFDVVTPLYTITINQHMKL
ncbi:MAG: hypothetical protein NC247_02325 [Ruminococcus flavefaciens]|nr:hypothetical protein [Ruminococcus flavefaciens]